MAGPKATGKDKKTAPQRREQSGDSALETFFPSLDPDVPLDGNVGPRPRRGTGLRRVSLREILPSMVTLLALCAGLTSIRLGLEGRFEMAVGAIVLAAMLDAVDGRVARLLKSASRFGAELDSLADFVNFGVAPAVLLYVWSLSELNSLGWIAALIFAICCGLRLARFNSQLNAQEGPSWRKNYFQGVPAPAGALVVLLPLSLSEADLVPLIQWPIVTLGYTVLVGLLMVSTLPSFSGKRYGENIPRSAVLPLLVVVVLFVALLVSYLFRVLSVGSIAYLAHLPLAYRAYKAHLPKDRTGKPAESAGSAGSGDSADKADPPS